MYSKGISWINDCRIPFNIEKETPTGDMYYYINNKEYPNQKTSSSKIMGSKTKRVDLTFTKGRFPANILVSDDMLNDGIITKQSQRTYKPTDNSASLFGNSPQAHGVGIGDKGSSSRYYSIDSWFNNLLNIID